jgi:hypothetical protein
MRVSRPSVVGYVGEDGAARMAGKMARRSSVAKLRVGCLGLAVPGLAVPGLAVLGLAILGLAVLVPAGLGLPAASGAIAPVRVVDGGVLPVGSAAPLLDFRESEIKFRLTSLMSTLRDNRHEGWVLAAYPDPKTKRPLIGAGFSLDVPAREHPQYDPLNENTFVEPSSAELWAAAGLSPAKLDQILARFDRDVAAWSPKSYRRKIQRHTLTPELTEAEALSLLRISAIQAVHNAKAYCRNFDQLTGSQQMALSQLVFQMGVNLEQFAHFLSALNGDTVESDLSRADGGVPAEGEQWRRLQLTLVESEWARRYTTRAQTVIAMFDPMYTGDPVGAQRRVEAMLPTPVVERRARRKAGVHTLRAGAAKARGGKAAKPHKRRLA